MQELIQKYVLNNLKARTLIQLTPLYNVISSLVNILCLPLVHPAVVTRVVNTYGPQTRSGGGGAGPGEAGEQQRGPMARDCGNAAIEERLHNIENHLKLPTGQRRTEQHTHTHTHSASRCILCFLTLVSELLLLRPYLSLLTLRRSLLSFLRLHALYLSLFSSRPGSTERLPETEEAGGSNPGVGGTLAGVLPVHGEPRL